MRDRKAFTLIELLIVVAIIAILAAIAVPNFLEAQTRSKVGRVKADMRSLATGLESYQVDNNRYPPDPSEGKKPLDLWSGEHLLAPLTSPIAYMSSLPTDPFIGRKSILPWMSLKVETYTYWGQMTVATFLSADLGHDMALTPGFETAEKRSRIKWLLMSDGPDHQSTDPARKYMDILYDPSNGTVSKGDIYRWGP